MKDIERTPDGTPKYFYWFTFGDGYRICCAGFSGLEMRKMVLKHGDVVSREPA